MLNQRVRGANALAHITRQPPLGVIPYITTRDEVRARRLRLRLGVAACIGLMLLAAVLLHFLYQPLDMLLLKIASRLG